MPGATLEIGQSGHRCAATLRATVKPGSWPAIVLHMEVNYPMAFPDPG
jgi:hypothetical protein